MAGSSVGKLRGGRSGRPLERYCGSAGRTMFIAADNVACGSTSDRCYAGFNSIPLRRYSMRSFELE